MCSPSEEREQRRKDKHLTQEFVEALLAGNDLTTMVIFDNYPRLQDRLLKVMDHFHRRGKS